MTTQHFFAPGQSVRLANVSRFTLAAPGEYKVTRLLPESAGELQCRVRSDKEAYERVIGENELKAQIFQGAFKTDPPRREFCFAPSLEDPAVLLNAPSSVSTRGREISS